MQALLQWVPKHFHFSTTTSISSLPRTRNNCKKENLELLNGWVKYNFFMKARPALRHNFELEHQLECDLYDYIKFEDGVLGKIRFK